MLLTPIAAIECPRSGLRRGASLPFTEMSRVVLDRPGTFEDQILRALRNFLSNP